MGGEADTAGDIVEYSSGRAGAIYAVICWVAVLAWAIDIALKAQPGIRYLVIPALMAIAALYFSARWLPSLIQPARLTLKPSGLVLQWPGATQSWSWSEVGAFCLRPQDHEGEEIVFSVGLPGITGEAREGTIPDLWGEPIGEVCRSLNNARNRWA